MEQLEGEGLLKDAPPSDAGGGPHADGTAALPADGAAAPPADGAAGVAAFAASTGAASGAPHGGTAAGDAGDEPVAPPVVADGPSSTLPACGEGESGGAVADSSAQAGVQEEAEQKVLGYLRAAPDWSKVLDTGGGAVYYWNLSTDEVVWEVPEGLDPDDLLPREDPTAVGSGETNVAAGSAAATAAAASDGAGCAGQAADEHDGGDGDGGGDGRAAADAAASAGSAAAAPTTGAASGPSPGSDGGAPPASTATAADEHRKLSAWPAHAGDGAHDAVAGAREARVGAHADVGAGVGADAAAAAPVGADAGANANTDGGSDTDAELEDGEVQAECSPAPPEAVQPQVASGAAVAGASAAAAPPTADEDGGSEGVPSGLRARLLATPQETVSAVLESLAGDASDAAAAFMDALPAAVRLAVEAQVGLEWRLGKGRRGRGRVGSRGGVGM
eukprot:364748-Chlamydomonas_euryale.AAC.3